MMNPRKRISESEKGDKIQKVEELLQSQKTYVDNVIKTVGSPSILTENDNVTNENDYFKTDEYLQRRIKWEKEHWKQVYIRIIAAIKYLCKDNLTFQGSNEKHYHDFNGNFMGVIEMMTEFDDVMKIHDRRIENQENDPHYLGHEIQNEVISILSQSLKTSIIKIIKKARYFSVIIDCTPDLSDQGQITLIIRCVNMADNKINIVEYFIDFLKVNNTSGVGLLNESLDVLKLLDLNVDDLRGFVNGFNMKEENQSIQNRLLEINPRALYMPYACHSLNYTISDMALSCDKAVDFIGLFQRIFELFSSSPKRWQFLLDNIPNLTVKSYSNTRWETKIKIVKAIRFHAPQIRLALRKLYKSCDDAMSKSQAKSLVYEVEDFEFILGMIIWYDILFAINSVSKKLESRTMCIDTTINQIESMMIYFEKYKNNGFVSSMNIAKEIACEMDVEPTFDKTNNENEIQSDEESFRVEYFLVVVDMAIACLKNRFDQLKTFKSISGFLYDSEKLKSLDETELRECCNNFATAFSNNDACDVDPDDLFTELKLLKKFLPNKLMSAVEILEFAKVRDWLPYVSIAYRILLTVPITVASVDKKYSKLKLVRNYLKSSMSEEKLDGLGMLCLERDMLDNVDLKTVISDLASKKAPTTVFL